MLESQAEVVGLHPMTAPLKTPTLTGRVVVVCEARLEAWRPWLQRLLDALHEAGDDPAFLTLAEDACARAGLRARHAAALDRLLTSGEAGPAALLALARATTLRAGDARLAPAIARAVAVLSDAPPGDAFARAWLLRALRAVQAARIAGALVLDEDTRALAAGLTQRETSWLDARGTMPTDPTALRAALLLARLAPDALVMRMPPATAAA